MHYGLGMTHSLFPSKEELEKAKKEAHIRECNENIKKAVRKLRSMAMPPAWQDQSPEAVKKRRNLDDYKD